MKKLLLSSVLLLSSMCGTALPVPMIIPIAVGSGIGAGIGSRPNSNFRSKNMKPLKSDTLKDVIKSTADMGKCAFLDTAPEFSVGLGAGLGTLGCFDGILFGLQGAALGIGIGIGIGAAFSAVVSGVTAGALTASWHNKFMSKNLPDFKEKIGYHDFIRLSDNDLNIA